MQHLQAVEMDVQQVALARVIDHTRLTFAPGEEEEAVLNLLCQEARTYGFYSVCVRPRHVAFCKARLEDSSVKVVTVIGFPAGKVKLESESAQPTIGRVALPEKLSETRQAVLDGADELDVVIDVAQLKADARSGSEVARQDLKSIQEAAQGRPLKVIIETDLLSDAELVLASRWCAELRLLMVKTSTGMVEGGQGATVAVVRRIQDTVLKVYPKTKVKASGGIKTQAQAEALLKAGAARLGTSSGVALVSRSAQSDTDTQSAY